MFPQTADHLRRIEAAEIGPLLSREADDASRILRFHWRQRVLAAEDVCNLQTRPLHPGIQSCGKLHYIRDMRSTDPRRSLEEVEAPIRRRLDELRVSHSVSQPQSLDQLQVNRMKLTRVMGV